MPYALLAGLFCSALLGYFVTKRGIRSLQVLADTVKRITATSLGERVSPAEWPIELVALATTFNRMLDRVEASFKRLKQFSGDLSHELRTPIMNVVSQTEMAISYDNSKENCREVMESTLEEMQKISAIIENILFLARADDPSLELVRTTIQARHEIDSVCEFYQPVAEDNQVQLTCHGEAELSVNLVMFKRLMSNLISNALKYTPNGGAVDIYIQNQANHKVQIDVVDTGSGIAEEHLPYLFNRFYRADGENKQHGHGLGLAIVKSIVDVHQADIEVKSVLGKGTTVCLIFSGRVKCTLDIFK